MDAVIYLRVLLIYNAIKYFHFHDNLSTGSNVDVRNDIPECDMNATKEHIVVCIIHDIIDVVCQDVDVQYPSIVDRGRKRKRGEKMTDQPSFENRKIARNTGKQYENSKGKQVRARILKPTCGEKCRLQCSQKISNEAREKIFHSYWKLGCIEKQRALVTSTVQ